MVRSAMMALVCLVASAVGVRAQETTSAEILVLGDSQIGFGTGAPLTELLSDLETACGPDFAPTRGWRVATFGVRSTAIRAWVARSGAPKGHICDKDKTHGVNAAVFGAPNPDGGRRYEQIGEHAHSRFCEADRSALEALFSTGGYAPRLLVLSVLGNAAEWWADKPAAAAADVAELARQLPPGQACLFMTTAPGFSARVNGLRARAQSAVLDAFRARGGPCVTVSGLTDESIAAIEGRADFFRRREDGTVKDPYHPLEAGGRSFVALRREAICRGVGDALGLGPSVAQRGVSSEQVRIPSSE